MLVLLLRNMMSVSFGHEYFNEDAFDDCVRYDIDVGNDQRSSRGTDGSFSCIIHVQVCFR